MANFEISYKKLERWEGGYSNILSDRGGETYKGISRKNYPDNIIWTKIDELKNNGLTKMQIDFEMSRDKDIIRIVKEFYKKEYWEKMHLDKVEYQDFACNIFLLAVNAGVKRAIKVGQEACSIFIDGVLGDKTLEAFRKTSYKETEKFTTIEIKYYEAIVQNDETQRKFLNGWIKRAREV